jgi:hypothetical protein
MELLNISVTYYVYLTGSVINFLLQSSAIAIISKHVSDHALCALTDFYLILFVTYYISQEMLILEHTVS